MNKRIDKLLVKAGAYFGGDGVVYDTFDPKKFAELIIAEFGAALFDESERLSGLYSEEANWHSAQEYEIRSNQCIDNIALIEKHFGVEE
jgi:hypothetical protein